jgi:hypothetical protein
MVVFDWIYPVFMAPRRVSALVVAAALMGCGASEPPAPTGAVCWSKRPRAPNGGFKPVRPTDWMNVMLKGFHWRRGEADLDYQAHYDCSGEPIADPPVPVQCPQDPAEEVRIAPLKEESVIERLVPTGERLVWIITHRLSNGDGLGPIALISLENRFLSVQAIGDYRGRSERVQMHLWTVGAGQVLVVEGEKCKNPKLPATCRREARILVRKGDRFVSRPILNNRGGCIEPAQIEYSKKANVSTESGWIRHFSYNASVSHDVRYLVVTEQIDINDTDPSQSSMPPRHVRRVDTERFIHLKGLNLISRQGPLWRRMMPTRGSTELDEDETTESEK